MKELYRFRQFLTEGVIKEDNLKDYWSEWAAGEVKVGNDDVIDAGGVDADFKDVPDDTMDTFKRYVKAVKTLNASSKELRNDIAGAVSGIFYGGGGFEDYEFDVLTSDQFDKIGLSEGKLYEEEKMYTLYTTNVEYDNGKTGYMYQLVNSEDGEENEIGFDQLYFVGKGDASDPRVFTGKDFKEFDQYSYQEEEVSAEEAMKIYNELK